MPPLTHSFSDSYAALQMHIRCNVASQPPLVNLPTIPFPPSNGCRSLLVEKHILLFREQGKRNQNAAGPSTPLSLSKTARTPPGLRRPAESYQRQLTPHQKHPATAATDASSVQSLQSVPSLRSGVPYLPPVLKPSFLRLPHIKQTRLTFSPSPPLILPTYLPRFRQLCVLPRLFPDTIGPCIIYSSG